MYVVLHQFDDFILVVTQCEVGLPTKVFFPCVPVTEGEFDSFITYVTCLQIYSGVTGGYGDFRVEGLVERIGEIPR